MADRLPLRFWAGAIVLGALVGAVMVMLLGIAVVACIGAAQLTALLEMVGPHATLAMFGALVGVPFGVIVLAIMDRTYTEAFNAGYDIGRCREPS